MFDTRDKFPLSHDEFPLSRVSLPLCYSRGNMSTNNEATKRSRSMKRSFVLLRFCDALKVPRPNVQRVLEGSGHCKELEFLNNYTASAIQELLSAAFQPHLKRDEVSR